MPEPLRLTGIAGLAAAMPTARCSALDRRAGALRGRAATAEESATRCEAAIAAAIGAARQR